MTPETTPETSSSRPKIRTALIPNRFLIAIALIPCFIIALCLMLSSSPRWIAQYAAKWYLPVLLPFGNVRMVMAHIGPMDDTSVTVNATVVCLPAYTSDDAMEVDEEGYRDATDIGTQRFLRSGIVSDGGVSVGVMQVPEFGPVWARFETPTRLKVAILAQLDEHDERKGQRYNDQERIRTAERVPVGYVQMLHGVALSPIRNTRSNWQVLFNITDGDGYRELVRQILMTRSRIRGKVVLEVEGEVDDVQLMVFGHVFARLEKISVSQLVQLRDAAADEEKETTFDSIRDIKGLFSLLARVINGDRNVMDNMPSYLSFSEFKLHDSLPQAAFPALPFNAQNISSSLPFSMYVHFRNPTGIEFDRVGMYSFQITYNSTALIYFTVIDFHLNRYGSSKVRIFGQIVRTYENSAILDQHLIQTLLAPHNYPAHINLTGSDATPSQNLLGAMVQPTLAGVRVPLYEFAPTFLPLLQSSGVTLTDIIAGIVPSFQIGYRLPSSVPLKITINNTLGCTLSFRSVDVAVFRRTNSTSSSVLGEIHHMWPMNTSVTIPPFQSADVLIRVDLSVLALVRDSWTTTKTGRLLDVTIRSFDVSLGSFPISFRNVTVEGVSAASTGTETGNRTVSSLLPMLKQAMKKVIDVRELLESSN